MKTGVRGLIGLVLAGLLAMTGAPPAVADEVVTIPDPALSACITRNLAGAGLPTDFTAENLAKLVKLGCGTVDGVLGHLTGLDKLGNLAALTLRLDGEVDLGDLASLPDLTALTLNVGLVARISLPHGLHLNSLSLSAKELPIVPELVARTITLDTLSTSLDTLGSIVAETATIRGRDLSDVSILANAAIRSLTLQGGPSLSLDGVGAVDDLDALFLPTLPASYAGLAEQSSLRALTLEGSPQLRDLDTLPTLAGLKSLEVASTYLTALPDLSRFPALSSLTVHAGAQFATLGPPRSLSALEEIHVRSTSLSDITALVGATRLRTVDLYGNHIADVSPLSSLGPRCVVTLAANRITDISALAGISPDVLDLSSNQITDITPLAGMPAGATLVLTANRITDFAALEGWSGTLSARGQRTDLPTVNVDFPYTLPAMPRGADGAALLAFPDPGSPPATLTDGRMGYSAQGYYYWAFRNAPRDEDATITLTALQKVLPRVPFTSVPQPTIPALQIGMSATATVPGWTPAAEQLSYQWYVSEVQGRRPIPGATSTTFTPTADLAGATVEFVATGRSAGYLVTEASAAASVPFLEYSGPQRVTLGAARVVTQGTVLTAVGVWDQGVTATYHWVVGGQETTVTGGPTYATTASDAGHLVIVNVWLEKLGYRKMMVSDAVTVVNAKLASVAPKIVGTPRVGKKLSVRTAWPSGTTLDYQWYRYSRKISGATGATYRLRKTDRGKWLQVMVTASRPGYDTMTRFSGPSKRVRR